jgi:hypothetical protein
MIVTILFTLQGVRHAIDAPANTAYIAANAIARMHAIDVEVWRAAALVATVAAFPG